MSLFIIGVNCFCGSWAKSWAKKANFDKMKTFNELFWFAKLFKGGWGGTYFVSAFSKWKALKFFPLWSNFSFWMIFRGNFCKGLKSQSETFVSVDPKWLFCFWTFFSGLPANRKISYSPSFIYHILIETSEHPSDCLCSAAAAKPSIYTLINYYASQGCVR